MHQMRAKTLDLRRAGQADIELANALDRAAADRDERGGAA
jgi:hypothetical protein